MLQPVKEDGAGKTVGERTNWEFLRLEGVGDSDYRLGTIMPELLVGKETDFEEGDRRIIVQGELEIGVFRIDGEFFAYQNQCAHRGGPVCQGKILGKVEEVLAEDQTSQGLKFSEESIHIICPWHGFEYDLRSGVNAGDGRLRLKKYQAKVKDGSVYVII